jgi:hypothetical protein
MIKSKIIISIMITSLLLGGCTLNNHPTETIKGESIIEVGMEFSKADTILTGYRFQKNHNLQIIPQESPSGEYMSLEIYGLRRKPYIIVNYEKENGENIIRTLSLYYRKRGSKKNDPENKWINVEKIDLNNI